MSEDKVRIQVGALIATAEAEGVPAAAVAGWQTLSTVHDYLELDLLVDELAHIAANFPPSPDLAILRGATYQKRCEWTLASDFLLAAITEFPGRTDIIYEAALNSVDAVYYPRADELLQMLSRNVANHPERIQRGMWRACALIGRHDIALGAFEAASAAKSAFAEPQLAFRLQTALTIQAAVRQCGMRSISIGENCLPWMVLNRWGLRADPTSSGADSIFNLAQTSTDGSVGVLADAGVSLTASEKLDIIKNPQGVPRPINRPNQFDFNHEQGRLWISDDYAELNKRYAARIDNFQTYLDGSARLFVHYTESGSSFARLTDALAAINRDVNYRLLILDAGEASQADTLPGDGRTDYVHVPRPSSDYIWFRPDSLDSPEGVEFEWRIAKATLRSFEMLLGQTLVDVAKLETDHDLSRQKRGELDPKACRAIQRS